VHRYDLLLFEHEAGPEAGCGLKTREGDWSGHGEAGRGIGRAGRLRLRGGKGWRHRVRGDRGRGRVEGRAGDGELGARWVNRRT